MHILVVDDNEANRFLAKSLLEREANTVSTATNGLEAISQCESIVFDLILMDILMPLMDGVKTLRKLNRSKGQNSQTPIFALTSYCTASDQRNYRQAGFDFVLSKPFRYKDFETAWACYLNKRPYLDKRSSVTNEQDFTKQKLLDPDIWNQLTSHASVPDLQNVIKSFWEHAQLSLKTINQHKTSASHMSRDSLSKLRKIAHGLKGASSSQALSRMAKITAELQNAPPEHIIGLVNSLQDCMKRSQFLHYEELNKLKTRRDFAEDHFDDVDEPREPTQIQA